MILYSKKIVEYFSMIFTFTGDDLGLDSIFHGKNLNINNWESRIPSPEMDEALFGDPALVNELYQQSGKQLSYIGNLYLHNQISSARIAIGKIANVIGFLQPEFDNISNVFKEQTDTITIAISTADAIINSEYFAKGLDALGAIPIVGWIIKIIVKAAELVYKIIKKINDNKIKNVRKELAAQVSIPLTEFNKDADEALARATLYKIAENNLDYIFSPRYIFQNASDFVTVSEKINDDDEITRYFNVRSEVEGGLGFIPGTVNLSGALRFPTKGAQSIYDTGDLYPTVRSLGSMVNQLIQKPGPALYGLNTKALSVKWQNNIYSLLAYAEDSIKKGWSIHETGYPNTDEWICAESIIGYYGDKACKKAGQVGTKYKTFSTGHYAAFRAYLIKRYFGNKFPSKSGKISPTPDDVLLDRSIPVKALENILKTQEAVIDSDVCMYVNLETKGTVPYFSGLYSNYDLRKKWMDNVKLVLNSEEWKRIRFLDVPDGEVKNALYEKATSKGYDPIKKGPISKTIGGIATKSVLKNPKPPSPFKPVNVEEFMLPRNKKTATSGSSVFLAAAALGAFGYLAKKK